MNKREKRTGERGLAPRKAVIGFEAEFNLYVGGEKKRPEEVFRNPQEIVRQRMIPRTGRSFHMPSGGAVYFDTGVIDMVRSAAEGLKLSNMDMPSGAGHDAMHIAKLCPAGMIFVPCERGISHNEIENASPSDLAAGTRVLVEVLERLANR